MEVPASGARKVASEHPRLNRVSGGAAAALCFEPERGMAERARRFFRAVSRPGRQVVPRRQVLSSFWDEGAFSFSGGISATIHY